MVAGARLLALDGVAVAAVDHAHSSSPLTRRFDTDIFGRRGGWHPERIIGGESVPDTDWIMHAQRGIISNVARVQFLQGLERVGHESRDPFGEWGTRLNERKHGRPELATGEIVAQGDVQGEQTQGQLTAELGRVWRQLRCLGRRQGRVRVGRCECKDSSSGKSVCVGVEFADGGDLRTV